MPSRISILGCPIDSVTHLEALDMVKGFLRQGGQHHVMTPNPEMLVEAQRNPAFLQILLRSALNIPDGTGVLWAAARQHTPLRERVTGVDFLRDLCLSSDLPPVFFLGAAPGIAKRAADILRVSNPSLAIAGTYAGSPAPYEEQAIIERINASGAAILFVAYGAPAQDIWIDRNLVHMPKIRVAMGVGGSFDFIAGTKRRAPVRMRSLGLEWVWRLLLEPQRIGRIFTAVVVFPWMVRRAGSRGARSSTH
jgi:N-acetylglucosaminyldiphosphoundecaprenol N-acetyl-beta-D-mannosaminyltransferase